MIDKNGVGVIILSHDSEDRTLVDGFEEKGSYVRTVHYIGAGVSSVAQISGIPMVSAYCEQFIKYECKGSLLFRSAPAGWWHGYHLTAFRCCIGVEPLQMISKSAHAGLHPQTHV